MEYNLQLLDTKKLLRIALFGAVLTLVCFVFTFIKIKDFGFFIWLLSPLIFIPFIIVGIKKSNMISNILIKNENYLIDSFKFSLNDVISYELASTGFSHRINIRLNNNKKISLVCRDKSIDKEKFFEFTKAFLKQIKLHNEKTGNQEIIQFDPFHAKYSKLIGVVLILIDLLMTYGIIMTDSEFKYFGVLMINLIFFTILTRIFGKKKENKYFG